MGDESAQVELPDDLREELRGAWHRYVDRTAPLRPALHAYCRRLTGDVFDAEDLVQDTLIRAFGRLGSTHQPVANPRAYLLRIATHAWIDTLRRRGRERELLAAEAREGTVPSEVRPGALHEAGAALLERLAPQERAAVVLKDVFELSLAETAEVLETTVGAVKAALHRGRERLRDPEPERATRPKPPAELVDAFVASWRAGDIAGLKALMLEDASVEQVGCGYQWGAEVLGKPGGFLFHAVHGHPEWPEALQYSAPRLERRLLDGEPVAVGFCTRKGREAFEQLMRFEVEQGRIARLRTYAFCPEVMRAVAEPLGVPVRTGLYRFPTPAPGRSFQA